MFENGSGNSENAGSGLFHFPEKQSQDEKPSSPVPAPVPLESVHILALVKEFVCQFELTQVFINKEEHPIEAVYFFPVDSTGGVSQFKAYVEGRKIKRVVMPVKEANAQYEKGIELKQTAVFVDSYKPDIFKVRIGFLRPGARIKVVIDYLTELRNEEGSNSNTWRLFIPTTIVPRYAPAQNTGETSIELKPINEAIPAPLKIEVRVALCGEIRSVESPTHKVTVTELELSADAPDWNGVSVDLAGTTKDMERDFVLLITPGFLGPRLYKEEYGISTAYVAHLIPRFTLEARKVELIFIVDCSESMQGKNMELAKRALMLFLRSIPVDCYLNIAVFDNSFELFYPESVKYNVSQLNELITFAKALQTTEGGSDLFKPLHEVFNMRPVPGYLRQILVLTDGQILHPEAVLDTVRSNAHLARLFSLGIGDACSYDLVERLAEEGGGTFSFVTCNESIDAKVLQQLKNAVQPSLSNVRVEWEGVPLNPKKPSPIMMTSVGPGKPLGRCQNIYSQMPEKVPQIFDGCQLVVYGIFETMLPTGVHIFSPDGLLSINLQTSAAINLGPIGMVHQMAGIKLAHELEKKIIDFSSWNSGVEHLKERILRFSCKLGISSKYTSSVSVHSDREYLVPKDWVMQTRYVPFQIRSNQQELSTGRPRVRHNSKRVRWMSESEADIAQSNTLASSSSMMDPDEATPTATNGNGSSSFPSNGNGFLSIASNGAGGSSTESIEILGSPTASNGDRASSTASNGRGDSSAAPNGGRYSSTASSRGGSSTISNGSGVSSTVPNGGGGVAKTSNGGSSTASNGSGGLSTTSNGSGGSSTEYNGSGCPSTASNGKSTSHPSGPFALTKDNLSVVQLESTNIEDGHVSPKTKSDSDGTEWELVDESMDSPSPTPSDIIVTSNEWELIDYWMENPKEVIKSSNDFLNAIALTQSRDGSFALTKGFANLFEETLEVLQEEARKHGIDTTAFATSFMLAYFTKDTPLKLSSSLSTLEGRATRWLVRNFTNSREILGVGRAFVNNL